MADKSTRLILDALTRAAAEPAGLPLFAAKAAPGLFPATASAKAIAQRCRDDGLIQPHSADGKLCAITDKGLQWLMNRTSPRQVLEDFLRVLEQKQAQTEDLISAARQMAAGLESLKSAIERLTPNLNGQAHHVTPQTPSEELVSLLDHWRSSSEGDCPLPELYRRLTARHAGLSIGKFHDLLRQLHESHRVYLHPWTGPLYEMPEPPLALLVGHEVAYYASPRLHGGNR